MPTPPPSRISPEQTVAGGILLGTFALLFGAFAAGVWTPDLVLLLTLFSSLGAGLVLVLSPAGRQRPGCTRA